MAGQRHLTGDSAAKGEAAVGGQVRDIQDGIAQKQSQRNEGVDAAQLERGLDDVERKDTRQHGVLPFILMCNLSVSLPLDSSPTEGSLWRREKALRNAKASPQ